MFYTVPNIVCSYCFTVKFSLYRSNLRVNLLRNYSEIVKISGKGFYFVYKYGDGVVFHGFEGYFVSLHKRP